MFEQRKINYALWIWRGSWPLRAAYDDVDFTHGQDPNNHSEVATSALLRAIQTHWKRNQLRPSNVVFTDMTGPATPLCCGVATAPALKPPTTRSRFPMPSKPQTTRRTN